MSNIDLILKDLIKVNDYTKGDIGEKAAFEAVKKYKKHKGCGILINTIKYPYVYGEPGNVAQDNGKIFTVDGTNCNDEIDILYVSNFRIFIIEVKAYRGYIRLTDNWTYHGKTLSADEHNVIEQTEKHCRHFYHTFWEGIPNGNPDYIQPIHVCVDKATHDDRRSQNWKNYLPSCILNNLNATIAKYDKPLEYQIDLSYFMKILEQNTTFIGQKIL